ncbi:hypothetical protein C7972_1361 [Arenibacter sp. ARW7G5Y1]|nr:hypothetical protein C7972_1361 [Arenibacter sp. ARW7G5Y1]
MKDTYLNQQITIAILDIALDNEVVKFYSPCNLNYLSNVNSFCSWTSNITKTIIEPIVTAMKLQDFNL